MSTPAHLIAARSGPAHPVIPIFGLSTWQMSFGERAALEGLLAQLRPSLALEIGTAQGGSLQRLAAHCGEIHSFDIVEPSPDAAGLFDNVTFHTGDSHQLLPQVLARLASEGRNVDFALVDGDHTADGVERDMLDLLESDAVTRTVIVMHDTMNEVVREGLSRVPWSRHGKVSYVDLDVLPGYLARDEPYSLQLWGGMGMVLVGEWLGPRDDVRETRFYELFDIVEPVRRLMEGERAAGRSPEPVGLSLVNGAASAPAEAVPGPPGVRQAAGDLLRALAARTGTTRTVGLLRGRLSGRGAGRTAAGTGL